MARSATARRASVSILELTDLYHHQLLDGRRSPGDRPGGRGASHNGRAIPLTEARHTANIRVLWSGIRGKTLAAAADMRGPRTSTTEAARSARSASTASASGRLTDSSGGWSRSCLGGRGPDHAVRHEPEVRTRRSFCDGIQNFVPLAPAIRPLISSTCRAVHAGRPPRCPALRFAREAPASVPALPPISFRGSGSPC